MFTGLLACAGNQDEETSTEELTNEATTIEATTEEEQVVASTEEQIVEVACGTCKLGLDGEGCKLAVKIDEKAYYVDGVDIETYAEDGLCSIIKKAKVEGVLADNTFKATKVEIVSN